MSCGGYISDVDEPIENGMSKNKACHTIVEEVFNRSKFSCFYFIFEKRKSMAVTNSNFSSFSVKTNCKIKNSDIDFCCEWGNSEEALFETQALVTSITECKNIFEPIFSKNLKFERCS